MPQEAGRPFDGQGPQVAVAQRGEIFLDRVDLMGNPLELAQDLALAGAKDTINDDWHLRRAPRGSAC
jgi:hypothetical protein